MGLKEDLTGKVSEIIERRWSRSDGIVVPDETRITFANEGIDLDATVLYADLSDSTELVEAQTALFAAEIYKTFLHCAAKIITAEGGNITAYDGDRIMAVYIGNSKNSDAVRTALKINYARLQIIIPALQKQYPKSNYVPKHVVGIDTSKLFVAKAGVRGSNDLVWVGRSANHAAKLTALSHENSTYITDNVFDVMIDEVKTSNGTLMWKQFIWKGRTIYGSTYRWHSV
jgi:class 3 adenylate cyclase